MGRSEHPSRTTREQVHENDVNIIRYWIQKMLSLFTRDGDDTEDVYGEEQRYGALLALIREFPPDERIYEYIPSRNGRLSKLITFILGKEQRKEDLYKHLIVSLDNYRKDLENYLYYLQVEHPEYVVDVGAPIKHASEDIDSAKKCIENADMVPALRFFYSARERKIQILKILDEADNGDRVETFTTDLIQAGERRDEEWVDRAKEQLLNDNKSLKKDASNEEIRARYKDWYKGVIQRFESILTVKQILYYFRVTSLALMSFIIIFFLYFDLFGLFGGGRYDRIEDAPFSILYQNHFFLLVVVIGVLGAIVNTVRRWPEKILKPQLNQPRLIIVRNLFISRLIFGGIAAIIVYTIFISQLFRLEVSPGLLLILSFAAGFSDQIFVRIAGRYVPLNEGNSMNLETITEG